MNAKTPDQLALLYAFSKGQVEVDWTPADSRYFAAFLRSSTGVKLQVQVMRDYLALAAQSAASGIAHECGQAQGHSFLWNSIQALSAVPTDSDETSDTGDGPVDPDELPSPQ